MSTPQSPTFPFNTFPESENQAPSLSAAQRRLLGSRSRNVSEMALYFNSARTESEERDDAPRRPSPESETPTSSTFTRESESSESSAESFNSAWAESDTSERTRQARLRNRPRTTTSEGDEGSEDYDENESGEDNLVLTTELFDNLKLLYLNYVQSRQKRDEDRFKQAVDSSGIMSRAHRKRILDFMNITFEAHYEDWTQFLLFSAQGRDMYMLVCIKQYLLFGTVPHLKDNQDNIDDGFTLHYFIWRKPNNNFIPTTDRTITDENFAEYVHPVKMLPFEGWSKEQLATYLTINVLPVLLATKNVHADLSTKRYRNIINRLNKNKMRRAISVWIKNREQTIADYSKVTRRNMSLWRSDDGDDNGQYYVYYVALRLHEAILKRRKRLMKLWKSTVDQKPKHVNRFKWQQLCKPRGVANAFAMDDLRELAAEENIPHYLFLTQREICAELAKRFQNVIDGKKKVESRCINPTTILLQDIADVPPEFFYAYRHNNKVYCDDIRNLVKQFSTRGAKNPWDGTVMPQSIVKDVNFWYTKLKKSTTTLEDLFTQPEAPITPTSMLSAKTAELLNKLNYPNSANFFLQADKPQITRFIDMLAEENIVTNQEKRMLQVLGDVTQYKLTLIALLITKIDNDPDTVVVPGREDPLSTVAINVSNVYNEIFQ